MFRQRKTIVGVLLTAAAAGLFCGANKPQPPALKPQYRVLDLGVGYSVPSGSGSASVMNDQGQVVCFGDGEMVVLTPWDSNGDGFWDGMSELTILRPDRAWFADALGLTSDQELANLSVGAFGTFSIGQDGIVSGTISGNVCQASDGPSLYYFNRAFVVKTIDGDRDGINDQPWTDLGSCVADADGGELGFRVDTVGSAMNESGCIVGAFYMHTPTGTLPSQAFRIVPMDIDGDGVGDIWFQDLDGNGLNDLMEPLADLSSASVVDDVGRAYGGNPDVGGLVVLPDGTSSATTSLLDKMAISAGNSGGLAVGYYLTGKTLHAFGRTMDRDAPCLIQGRDTDTDGDPDLWYRDANGDGKNDLMVKLPMLSGYSDFSMARAVNDSGTIVGIGVSTGTNTSVHHALVWKNQVPADLNTLVAPSGVVLEEAVAINQDGVILCTGKDAAGAAHGYLLMPIAP